MIRNCDYSLVKRPEIKKNKLEYSLIMRPGIRKHKYSLFKRPEIRKHEYSLFKRPGIRKLEYNWVKKLEITEKSELSPKNAVLVKMSMSSLQDATDTSASLVTDSCPVQDKIRLVSQLSVNTLHPYRCCGGYIHYQWPIHQSWFSSQQR